MALSRVQYQQTVSGNRNFTVTMPYISKDHIKVSVAGVPMAFTWLNSNTIQTANAPELNAIIDINRETERGNLLVDFQDASTITESQLDLATRQAFYLAQEAFDLTSSTMAVANDGSYSASGRRLSVLGDPDSDDDAATAGWVKAQYSGGKDAHEERVLAETARSDTQALIQQGADSEQAALEYRNEAEMFAASAGESASEALRSENNAKVSEGNAKASEDAAKASEAILGTTVDFYNQIETVNDSTVVMKGDVKVKGQNHGLQVIDNLKGDVDSLKVYPRQRFIHDLFEFREGWYANSHEVVCIE